MNTATHEMDAAIRCAVKRGFFSWLQQIRAMNDMGLVSIGVEKVCAEIAVTVAGTRPGRSYVRPAMGKSRRMGQRHGVIRGRQEGDHAAVADGRWLAIGRDVDIEAWQRRLSGDPAKRCRTAIRYYDSSFQTEWREDSVIKSACTLKIICAHGHMAKH
jgi:hypothetical protein